MGMKIWQRYLFFSTLKFMLFFFFAIFLLYSLLDFSLHSSYFTDLKTIPFLEFVRFYFHHFVIRLDLFLPLSFLLAIIKVLSDMNTHHELVALQMSGLSFAKLNVPIFFIGLFATLLCYGNFEFFTPKALTFIQDFKTTYYSKEPKKDHNDVHVALLQDGSKLLYQTIDQEKKVLFDVFWLRSSQEILHCKILHFENSIPVGQFVDQFFFTSRGFMKKNSYKKCSLEEMKIATLEETDLKTPSENRSLSNLYNKLQEKTFSSQKEKPSLLSAFHHKLSMPLFSLLIFFALPPFCFRFSRNFHIFLLTAISLFVFISFYVLLHAVVILGENQVCSAPLAIWMPFLFAFFFFLFRFFRH
jgi:lipopolysaccharide export LptBFGC system permease protein LptF